MLFLSESFHQVDAAAAERKFTVAVKDEFEGIMEGNRKGRKKREKQATGQQKVSKN